jgi:hypothetical protein
MCVPNTNPVQVSMVATLKYKNYYEAHANTCLAWQRYFEAIKKCKISKPYSVFVISFSAKKYGPHLRIRALKLRILFPRVAFTCYYFN